MRVAFCVASGLVLVWLVALGIGVTGFGGLSSLPLTDGDRDEPASPNGIGPSVPIPGMVSTTATPTGLGTVATSVGADTRQDVATTGGTAIETSAPLAAETERGASPIAPDGGAVETSTNPGNGRRPLMSQPIGGRGRPDGNPAGKVPGASANRASSDLQTTTDSELLSSP
jgi:hypothetical protein